MFRKNNIINKFYKHKAIDKIFHYFFLVLLIFGISLAVYYFLPIHDDWYPGYQGLVVGIDWKGIFHPAINEMFEGRNPYLLNLFNPPWAFVLLSPIALFDKDIGAAIMFALNIVGFGHVAFKISRKKSIAILLSVSPFVLAAALFGNVDWMVALGFLMPPSIGLFFVLIKPQVGIGIALWWSYNIWKKNGFKKVLLLWLPVTLAFLMSFIFFGFYPIKSLSISCYDCNISLFPYTLPIGIFMLFVSLKEKQKSLAICSSVFNSPHVTKGSLSIFLVGLLPYKKVFLIVYFIVWFYQIITNSIFPLQQLLIEIIKKLLSS